MQIPQLMAVVSIAPRLARMIGIFTIALVATIPLMTLANDASDFLTPEGMKVLSTPWFVQMLVFGTAYAAIGEMMTSLVFSVAFMQLVRHFFTRDTGDMARTYIKDDVVTSVQENVFKYSTDSTE